MSSYIMDLAVYAESSLLLLFNAYITRLAQAQKVFTKRVV